MENIKKQLIDLLERNGFYYDLEEINQAVEYDDLELTRKAYGDSYERNAEEVFGKDYKKFKQLTSKLKITTPEYVWFDWKLNRIINKIIHIIKYR